MKQLSYLALLLGICLSCGKGSKEPAPNPNPTVKGSVVTVMTYNIYGARSGGVPDADLKAIAKTITDSKADLVALNEVDAFTTRNGKDRHLARDLAALTGMNWYFTKAMDFYGGEYGDAVLSKFPILESKRYSLSVADGVGGELRSVAMIKVKKDDKEFYFASTHLDHLQIEDNRILQANQLKQIVADLNKPLILAGDFNAKPDSQTMTIVKGYMTLGCRQQCPFTYPSGGGSYGTPANTIDYIMYSPVDKFAINSYNAIPYLTASDHAPVVATIEIK